MHIPYLIILLILPLLGGCGQKILSIEGDYHSISAKLDKKDNKPYSLVSSTKVLSESKSKDGELKFSLPRSYNGSSELKITDDSKKNVKLDGSDKESFTNEIWNEYIDYSNRVHEVERKLESTKTELNSLSEAQTWLKEHPSVYQNGQCTEPQNTTAQPKLACSPKEETNKAVAMCAFMMGGCYATSKAVGNRLSSGVAEILSGQVCEAYITSLQGAEYELKDVAESLGISLVDYAGDRLMKEDNHFLVRMLGFGLKVGALKEKVKAFNECTDRMSSQCSSLYNDWKREPIALLNKCNSKVQQVSSSDNTEILTSRIQEIQHNLDRLESHLIELKNKKMYTIFKAK